MTIKPAAAPGNGHWWRPAPAGTAVCPPPPKAGERCPVCGNGRLAYDGLFLLTCDRCGHVAEGGAFT